MKAYQSMPYRLLWKEQFHVRTHPQVTSYFHNLVKNQTSPYFHYLWREGPCANSPSSNLIFSESSQNLNFTLLSLPVEGRSMCKLTLK